MSFIVQLTPVMDIYVLAPLVGEQAHLLARVVEDQVVLWLYLLRKGVLVWHPQPGQDCFTSIPEHTRQPESLEQFSILTRFELSYPC